MRLFIIRIIKKEDLYDGLETLSHVKMMDFDALYIESSGVEYLIPFMFDEIESRYNIESEKLYKIEDIYKDIFIDIEDVAEAMILKN